jgi:hypothetical protein
MITALAQESLFDAFSDDRDEDQSGVRRRTPLAIELDAGPPSEPTPVYATTVDGGGRPRRYYLGTRFSLGVIAAAGWDEPMRRDGAAPEAIAAAAGWLRERAI